jgi:NAD+ synthase
MQQSARTEGPLALDPERAVQEISAALQNHLANQLKRRGFVVAMSGGIDSSACAALAVRAVGPKHVFGLFLPERESDPQSRELALTLANTLGIQSATESIDPILEASGCFKRRNDAIRRAVPDFKDNWGCKLVLPDDRMGANRVNVSSIVVQPPGGEQRRVRLGSAEYREVVAASNFKQRVRTMLAYFHADRLHYAVVGTPNRLEYDQGFFVKGGDGLADVKPIAHLYKTQVYQIARHLGVPEGILNRPPTTDTFSLPQSQEEFYFSLPAKTLDQILHARNAGRREDDVARELGMPVDEVRRAYADIAQKRATTIYLHLPPLLVKPVEGAPGAAGGAH